MGRVALNSEWLRVAPREIRCSVRARVVTLGLESPNCLRGCASVDGCLKRPDRAHRLLRLRLTLVLHRLGPSRSAREGAAFPGDGAAVRTTPGSATGRNQSGRVFRTRPVRT